MKSIPRCCFLLLLAAFVTLELCALALSWYCAREQVQRELVSDTYLAGSALLAPEDALSWSPISGTTPEQYAAGNAALERYGYDVHMNPTLQTAMAICGIGLRSGTRGVCRVCVHHAIVHAAHRVAHRSHGKGGSC